jgi:hypothetical protein
MRTILLSLALLSAYNFGFSQSDIKLEEVSRRVAMFLGAPQSITTETILEFKELIPTGEMDMGDYLVKTYVNKETGSLVYLRFGDAPWYPSGYVLKSINFTVLSSKNHSSFLTHIDQNRNFKRISTGRYKYLAFNSPMIELLQNMNHSTVIYEVKQTQEIAPTGKTLYTLTMEIWLDADK